uniref:Aryl hydrocarbon receptor 2 n=1 Tax=Gasterosteus aculeatus aculeatus TaxID=481459 RepID=G3P0S9_GASAC|nr:aryl hydrocarbon receptor-like [Gasterosteus aculeatus aculeatus]
MLGNPGSYANKKRKKPVLKQKKVSDGNDVVKSNPSKRHRDRLNGELDRLTDLLPFLGDVRSRLDKLSVLRLSVGYLRVKGYFKATMSTSSSAMFSGVSNGDGTDTTGFSEGELLLQALNGFVMVVTSDGLVFYVSSTVKDYLGFHQSDVVHQSVFELIHTDDRALFRQQLHFALNPPSAAAGGDAPRSAGSAVVYSPEQLPPENSSFLERSFVCRFRCLLDNSSGFLALKFQGRLKYLHGQKVSNGNGIKPQLALFSIAVPVQPPTIVEIRAKMLLFQTKHTLDFTPLGVDSRGKIILGYSEMELCMKGSGYQFIHAADMMHCADNHLRMIKTGESGLTVFRLLTKSGGWVWVKSNAKLIFKGGRPEFIIAYQRALVNAEGEEFLRQRRLQLPFSFTTGEGVLYNTGPAVDVAHFQFNNMFTDVSEMKKDVTPGSLLDCFLSQDQTLYTQTPDTPLPVDQVFMDSEALVTMGTSNLVVVKEEAKQSAMAVLDNLEKMLEEGDFCSTLQNLDVSDVQLMEWENVLKRCGQDGDQQSAVKSELDSVLTDDIFDFIDTVVFKDQHNGLQDSSPSSSQQNPFTQAGLREPRLFEAPSADRIYSPTNGLCARQQEAMNGPPLAESAQMFTQKLSHLHPDLPAAQQLQLQDIFSPSIELPELTVPDSLASPPSCGRAPAGHVGCPQTQSARPLRCPPAMAPSRQLLQGSARQPSGAAPAVMDMVPHLIPCDAFDSISAPDIRSPFVAARPRGSPSFEPHGQQVRQCPQSRQQAAPPQVGIVHNGQNPEKQARLWPGAAAGLTHAQQGALACGQAAAHSSCMFDQHFSTGPAGGDVLAASGSLGPRGGEASVDLSPPQGSCYYQWSRGAPVVGTSPISQQQAGIGPPNVGPIQRYRDDRVSAELTGMFAPPARNVAMYPTE